MLVDVAAARQGGRMSVITRVPAAELTVPDNYDEPPLRDVPLDQFPIDQDRGEHAMWCVIATELMLFVCMFGSYYYLGTNKDRWAVDMPPSLKYPFFLLAILLASSVVLEWGKTRLERGAFATARAALWITVLIGIGFMILQAFEYADHWRKLTPQSDSYGSIFYAITALHGAHVIAGLLMLAYVGVLPRYGETRGSPHKPYRAVTLYWHFVDFVWIWIVLLLYVLPHFQAWGYGH
jgi:cytochrome c oxidase subunit III